MNIGQKVSFTGYVVKDHPVIDGQVHTTHPLHKLDKLGVGYVVGARTLREGYTKHITEDEDLFGTTVKTSTFFPLIQSQFIWSRKRCTLTLSRFLPTTSKQ